MSSEKSEILYCIDSSQSFFAKTTPPAMYYWEFLYIFQSSYSNNCRFLALFQIVSHCSSLMEYWSYLNTDHFKKMSVIYVSSLNLPIFLQNLGQNKTSLVKSSKEIKFQEDHFFESVFISQENIEIIFEILQKLMPEITLFSKNPGWQILTFIFILHRCILLQNSSFS